MVFKVSLHDNSKNQSIVLSNHSNVTIGRGFFECQDKRVSKRHGELTVLETTIKIKACHSNPIFYKLKNEPIKKVLRKDSEIILGDSDIFSLLPDEFEWTVKIEQESEQNENPATTFRVRCTEEINDNLTQLLRGDSDPERTPSPDDLRRPDESDSGDTAASSSVSSSTRKRSYDEPNTTEGTEAKRLKESTSTQVPTSTTPETQPQSSSNELQSGSNSNSIPVANIKPDPDSTGVSPQNVEVKSEPVDNLDQPTSSSTTSGATKPDLNAVKTESTDDTCGQQSNVRPSCEFGIRCYRMTDDHRREYAHPMDNDYRRPNLANLAPPDAPRCPYWDGCYRRNPEHFRDFQHPPSDQYAPQRAPQISIQIHQVIPPPANPPRRRNRSIPTYDDDFDDIDSEDMFDDDDSDLDRDYNGNNTPSDLDDDLDDEENNLEE